ncbi:uncharacterized protein LOC9660057 isoform X2 [Selaginella moellendorffii]|uniref:uncharacterized protein LOC9660057 isoform X2 n=1 Tax=Selaginella moellendorffii TaxID=88036 RepID=UPI000D1CE967|nr:uncharacterized protein LOC9660057 isoform X2 [Selaginella moellendorffii]|eukprot:XP_024530019.1 uncharacterized protein LOC9660057 isoform X2 [Selaginella moellendorffii]
MQNKTKFLQWMGNLAAVASGELWIPVESFFSCSRKWQACSFQNKWKVYLDEDKLLFTTKRPFFFRLELCVDVYLGENTTPDFKLTGSAFTGKYCLHRTDTGELIAKVCLCFLLLQRDFEFDPQARSKRNLACVASYSIEIEPGVDSLFVVSMILTIVGRQFNGSIPS